MTSANSRMAVVTQGRALVTAALALAVMACSGCAKKSEFLGPPPPGTAPGVRIVSPAPAQAVNGLVVSVQLEIQNFVLEPPGSPVVYGHGHIEIRLDGGASQVVTHDTLSAVFPGTGAHSLEAKLVGNDGLPVEPAALDSVGFTLAIETTLSGDVEPIFKAHCALSGCHSGPNAVLGEDLSSAASAYATTVNVQSREIHTLVRVAPGDPDHSYTVNKVRGDQGILGQQMPLGGEPLSQQEIQTLISWIRAGAKNN